MNIDWVEYRVPRLGGARLTCYNPCNYSTLVAHVYLAIRSLAQFLDVPDGEVQQLDQEQST